MSYKRISVYDYDYQSLMYKRSIDTAENVRDPATYLDVICAFDIETTNIHKLEQSVMYAWTLAIDTDTVIAGRTWEEFTYFCERVTDILDRYHRQYDTLYPPRLVLYVHNLSFEFSFLQGIYKFTAEEVFAVDKRKVLKAAMYGNAIELRCSYLWSNMGLKNLTAKYNVEHQKLSGEEYDYDKPRYWFTELTEQEKLYQDYDVLGVVESVKRAMELDGDDLTTIPKTSTGYVRRDIRAACQPIYGKLKWLLPRTLDLYKILRAAFRGGNTHANRFVVGDINGSDDIELHHNIFSVDMASCYPAVLINEQYPMTPFEEIVTPNETILRRLLKHDACVMHITLEGVELKDPFYPVPYISHDRCQDIPIYDKVYNNRLVKIEGCKLDNGRVLKADRLSIAITDIDFEIIEQQYKYTSLTVNKLYRSHYGYLPQEFREVVREYFRKKTLLKGKKDELSKVLYAKTKALLNALYGMCAQDAVKEKIIYDAVEGFITKSEREIAAWDKQHPAPDKPDSEYEDMRARAWYGIRNAIFAGILEEYVNKTGFLPYQWGLYCTSHSRAYLERGIRYVHEQSNYLDHVYFCYCDTDSIKYADHKGAPVIDWGKYNEPVREKSRKNGGVAYDEDGKEYCLGVYESEDMADEFKTMGAKKYAALYGDELKITIAGVGKKSGAEYLKYRAKKDKCSPLDEIKDGFVFPGKYYDRKEKRYKDGGGGTIAKYNDDADMTIKVDGKEVHITANLYLGDGQKTIQRPKPVYYELTKLSAEELRAKLTGDLNILSQTLDKDLYF